MKPGLLIVVLCIFSIPSFSQEPITRNNLYVEAGGASFFYSVNYERLILRNLNRNLVPRIGFMYLDFFERSGRHMFAIPVGVSYIHRIKKNYLETGLTFSGTIDRYSRLYPPGRYPPDSFEPYTDLVIIPAYRFGIRHQPQENGFFWNAFLQAMVVIVDNLNFPGGPGEVNVYPFAGFGAGYAF